MSLEIIDVPDSVIKQIEHSPRAAQFIDDANDRIEKFMLATEQVSENFVTCDFHLMDQALAWIHQNRLLAGNRFCEWGSGFGVVAMLASLHSMEAVGIEVESNLVQQASSLAEDSGLDTEFYMGSFVPRDIEDQLEQIASEVENVETHAGDVYEQIGLAIDDYDLFFAFPWPGEHGFFEQVFDTCASRGALLLSYRGRDGAHLVRKS